MRLHSSVSGLRAHLGVLKLGIIGGLSVLPMLAVAACNDAEPNATREPTVPSSAQVATPKPSVTAPPLPLPVAATDVETVYVSPAYPLPWDQGEYDPLWGDLDADAPIINRLLRAIEGGMPVEAVEVEVDEKPIWTSYSSLVMNLRFRNGTTWSVRQLIRCDLTSEGKKTNCLAVPDHWELLHRNEVVVSTALTEWFERVQEYMPTVEYYEVPDPITMGEPFTISGAGYHEGDRVELSIKFSDERVMPLGEVPLDHGAFHWEGEIPETAHPGLANITMRGFEGTEVVAGITRGSVTVTAPSAAGAATELPDDATWVLDSLEGRPLIDASFVALRVDGDWFVGFDGCNSYGGRSEDGAPIADADGRFSGAYPARTLMACAEPDGVMDQADAYISALAQGERFRIVDDRLEIFDSGSAARLVFVKQAPLPGRPVDLEGTEWRLLIEGDAMDGVRAATLAFLDDRLVTGATSCRDYVATYRASEGALGSPGHSMLRSPQSWQSCTENARILEGEFGDFLTWAREYSVHEEAGQIRLRIRSLRGKALTFEPLPQTIEDIADAEWSLMEFVELRDLDVGVWTTRTTAVIEGTEVTISFGEDGLGGLSGCNSYGGPARLNEGSITVDVHLLHQTAKLCESPDGLMEQEERYFGLVNRLARYGIYDNRLFLQTADDVFLLFRVK